MNTHTLIVGYTPSDDGIHLNCRDVRCDFELLAGFFPTVDDLVVVQNAHRAAPDARVSMP